MRASNKTWKNILHETHKLFTTVHVYATYTNTSIKKCTQHVFVKSRAKLKTNHQLRRHGVNTFKVQLFCRSINDINSALNL